MKLKKRWRLLKGCGHETYLYFNIYYYGAKIWHHNNNGRNSFISIKIGIGLWFFNIIFLSWLNTSFKT